MEVLVTYSNGRQEYSCLPDIEHSTEDILTACDSVYYDAVKNIYRISDSQFDFWRERLEEIQDDPDLDVEIFCQSVMEEL